MSETPEAVRERIKAEELAKGSDPRVAEGRSKAAEMRTRLGLPIDPQEAWKARLAQEGGTPAAPAAAPAAPAEDAAPAAPAEDAAPAAPAEDAAPAAPAEDAAPAAPAAPAEEPEIPVPAAPAVPAPAVVPVFAPEIGELVESQDEVLLSVGGVKVRDARIATWILILLLSIPLWAMLYLLGLGGGDVGRATTGCIVEVDRSFVCFQPKHETGSGGGH